MMKSETMFCRVRRAVDASMTVRSDLELERESVDVKPAKKMRQTIETKPTSGSFLHTGPGARVVLLNGMIGCEPFGCPAGRRGYRCTHRGVG